MAIVQAAIIGSSAGILEKDRPDPHTGVWDDILNVSSGVRGTAYDPGGAVPAVENATQGLWRRHYLGNWSTSGNIDDINFFSNNSSVYELADTYVSFGYRDITSQSNYAFEWLGYIYCDSTDTYNFGVNVDDYARIWIGDAAIRGYNNSNAVLVAISGGVLVNSNSVILTSGYFYPVRIWFQEISGAEKMQVYFGHADGPFLTSMNQHPLWYNNATTGLNSHIFPTPGTGSYNADSGSSVLAGTPYDPGGAQATVNNGAPGFYRRAVLGEWYTGNYATTNMSFFDGKTVWDYRPDSFVSFGNQGDLQSQYSMYWLGYFQAPATGTYNLALDTDDQSMVWIGTNAISGFTGSNCVATQGGSTANSVSLTGGKWYPIRMWYDEHLGGNHSQLYIGQTGGIYYSMNYWYQAGRIAYDSVTNGLNAATYSLSSGSAAVNEGTALTFTVTTTGVSDGTTLYWTTGSRGSYVLTSDRFSPGVTGSVTVANNTASFSITVSADSFTATGSQSYRVLLASSPSPLVIVGNSVDITVYDSSKSPPVRSSAVFDATNRWIQVAPSSAWALGNTCTIEFWIKPRISSLDAPGQFLGGIMSQHDGGGSGIDIFQAGGVMNVADGSTNYTAYPEPAAGVWTHVAIVFPGAGQNAKVFMNGHQQTRSGGTPGAGQFANTTDGLTIGKRGPNVPFQLYDGKITNIRISTLALYSSDFIPTVLPTRNIGTTALLWTPTDQDPTTDLGDNTLSITNNNSVAFSSDYPVVLLPKSLSFGNDMPYMGMSPGYAFGTGAFTIQGWAKFTSAIQGGLVSTNGTVGAMACGFVDATNFFIYIPGVGPTATFTVSPAITTGTWHHFALVRDGSSHLALFIDGTRTGYDASHTSNYYAASDYLFNGVGAIGSWDTAKVADLQVSNTNLFDPTQTTITVPFPNLYVTAGVTKLLLDGKVSKTTDAAGVQTVTQYNGTITQSSDFPV
jgi:hypothetical protein